MERQESRKEKFQNTVEKAFENKEKYDYFGITPKKSKAFLNNSDWSDVSNAIVLLKQSELIREWEVKNYKIQKCPAQLYVCIKNLKILMGCAGNPNDESSFFELRIRKDKEATETLTVQDIAIFGVVEVNESVSAFYYNCATMESWYINQPSFQAGDTELYKLMEALRYMEGLLNEGRIRKLERREEFSERNWQNSQW